jgi:hypothetical protein
MARKVIIEEPNTVPNSILLGIAALILALGIGFTSSGKRRENQGGPA